MRPRDLPPVMIVTIVMIAITFSLWALLFAIARALF
jgi:hypothetical protein